MAIKSGADSITIHLREDQRHIKENDVILLKKKLKRPINLEMAMTTKMIRFAKKIKPPVSKIFFFGWLNTNSS